MMIIEFTYTDGTESGPIEILGMEMTATAWGFWIHIEKADGKPWGLSASDVRYMKFTPHGE